MIGKLVALGMILTAQVIFIVTTGGDMSLALFLIIPLLLIVLTFLEE